MTFTTFPHHRVNIGGDTYVFSYSNIEKNKITVTSANVIDPIHQLAGFIHCEHKLRNLSAFSEIAPGDVIFIGFLVSSPPCTSYPLVYSSSSFHSRRPGKIHSTCQQSHLNKYTHSMQNTLQHKSLTS